ncbi:P-loop containing nucleoside triphosphate hydrolase protein [Xylariomycetidae sp. FL0641]|nr:P-loop containing nucleoside triphosphate hydrolase protein [Xylariomycetidae sp. FL0641]
MEGSQLSSLQSKEYRSIMDLGDNLRQEGVGRHVNAPLIVVVGDQSSGKSSTLQRLSGMSFPVNAGIGTRFATELILRHALKGEKETCRVSIHPQDPSSGSPRLLGDWEGSDIHIGSWIKNVQMGVELDEVGFSSDVLRIELTGYNQPDLTVVDLPGLFRSGDKVQSAEGAKLVQALVRSYIKNPRSIILAVVSAQIPSVLQEVTELTRAVDPEGQRTLGLITKPDTLRNQDVKFRLGWHVVRNPDSDFEPIVREKQDRIESEFFARGIWSVLPQRNKGIATLQTRLSEVLGNHILGELPGLLKDIEKEMGRCSERLTKLGSPRSTSREQRKYLLKASQRFAALMQDSVDGAYRDTFFGDGTQVGDYPKRLRAVVRRNLEDFSEQMRKHGHATEIVDRLPDFWTPGPPSPPKTERHVYWRKVREVISRNRGRELPGTYNPLVIGDLFHEHCRPWRKILESFAEKILEAVHTTFDEALAFVVDENTKSKLMARQIAPALEVIGEGLHLKASEILQPHKTGHPITNNHYVTENFQKIQNQRQMEHFRSCLNELKRYSEDKISATVDEILAALTTQTEADMEVTASSAATDMMEAYYKVALKNVIHDFDTLAVEACLISQIPSIWTQDAVLDLSDDDLQQITGEDDDIVAERKSLEEKMAVLHQGRKDLKSFHRRRQQNHGK